MTKSIPIAAIGAGNRMKTYMHYVTHNPEKVRLVAIAEPDRKRREALCSQYGLPPEASFETYEALFASEIYFEAVFIATPGREHFRPAMMALDTGHHVLLEKPIAQNYSECEAIAAKAREKGLIVQVCHVLRYHPMFLKVKELVDSGDYGRIITIQHSEEVGIDRCTHSYVRGTLNNEKDSNPMLLDKCCHDVDFLLWLTGSRCRSISSFGSRLWFRSENAPEGSAGRCIDCAHEHRCPYSAVDLYRRRKEWIRNFVPLPGQSIDDVVEHELAEGTYGRCVYHCNNDVVDNQVVAMLMEDGTLINMSMNVFTQRDRRVIEIGMSEGQITCNGMTVNARNFRTRRIETYDFSPLVSIGFHGGADLALVEDFIASLQAKNRVPLSEIREVLESHRLIFEAERSRHTAETVHIDKY